MTEAILKIKHRSGTAAQWTAANPLLLASELGFENDTFTLSGGVRVYKAKFGDGTTLWNALPYFSLSQAAIISGLVKEPVRLATISILPLNGLSSVDGVPTVANDRVLYMGGAPGSGANGIYIAKAGAWVRTTDLDNISPTMSGASGAIIYVRIGFTNGQSTFTCTSNNPVIGSTDLTFEKNVSQAQLQTEIAARTAADTLLQTTKEPTIAAGTINDYLRGDKTWQLLNKASVGLGSVDNTSDANKPVSTAQAAADLANLNSSKAYADSLAIGDFNYRGDWAGTGTDFPTSGGRGAGGLPVKGDAWKFASARTIGGIEYDLGDIVIATINTPGQTPVNWGVSEHNTQQATESVRGTGMVATQAEAENNLSTDDQKYVVVKKLWFALEKFFTLRKASTAEINAGTLDTKNATVKGIKDSRIIDNTLVKCAYDLSGTNTYLATNATGVGVANNPNIAFVSQLGATNTAAPTINFGFGYSALLKVDGSAIAAGEFINGKAYTIVSITGGYAVLGMPFSVGSGGTSDTIVKFTAAWTTQTLTNVRSIKYYTKASDSTAKTINLYATPTEGDKVRIKDIKLDADTKNITINGNGKQIEYLGVLSSTFIIDIKGGEFTACFIDNVWVAEG